MAGSTRVRKVETGNTMGAVAPPNDEVPGAKPGPGQAIYRITLGWRIVTAVLFTAVICAALAGVYFALTGAMHILGAVFATQFVSPYGAIWARSFPMESRSRLRRGSGEVRRWDGRHLWRV